MLRAFLGREQVNEQANARPPGTASASYALEDVCVPKVIIKAALRAPIRLNDLSSNSVKDLLRLL